MAAISPSLIASSSTTAFHPSHPNEFDKLDDMTEFFDFAHYDSSSSSRSYSPKTISPNHTPSPSHIGPSPYVLSPSYGFMNSDMDFGLDYTTTQKAPLPTMPEREEVVVKEEPVEFGWDTGPSASISPPIPKGIDQPQAQGTANGYDFSGLPADQQLALQQLLANMINYQERFGIDTSGMTARNGPAAQPMTETVEPSMLFNPSPSTSTVTSTAPLHSSTSPAVTAPGPVSHHSIMHVDGNDADPLVSIEPNERPPARSARANSFGSHDFAEDIDAKIENLVPLPDIFSAGRGKGGKKGGGMSSVVRGDDEDLDDDDSWRPSPEEYKKLSSKEKRQLRNKLSARAFRTRRKDYIGTLEVHIRDRDTVIDAMRSELVNSRVENQDLRRELEALKSSTMSILHPESANVQTQSTALVNAFMSPSLPTISPLPQPARRPPTPKFNPRKDVPSSPAAFDATRGFWGGSNDPLGGGGSTICHTMFTPDLVLPANNFPSLRTMHDLPRVNLNPRLNEDASSAPRLVPKKDELDSTFSEWSENNAFNLRSLDTYRMQMWSRLAREAAAEKPNMPHGFRPKFYVEQNGPSASQLAVAATSHITSRLASSFWSAFSTTTTGKLDGDKLAAVVTGRARLRAIDVEKEAEAEDLIVALSGLRLQSGLTSSERIGLGVRENPLGIIGGFFKHAGGMPARV